MGLESFWRCDNCLVDHQVAHPAGWRLKGQRHVPDSRRGDIQFDLYLCSDKCAAQYFTNYADTYKES